MKKTMIASLAAAGMLFAVAGQAHAGTTLDAVKKKGFASQLPFLVMTAK